MLKYIKSIKSHVTLRIRRSALEHFAAERYLLASIYLNLPLAAKLIVALSAIFFILVLKTNPKEAVPDWLVLTEAIAYVLMIIIVVFLTGLRFKNKKIHREKINTLNREYEKLKVERDRLKQKLTEKNNP